MTDRIEIRPIREDEFSAAVAVTNAAFGENPTEEDLAAWQPTVPFERSLAAFEDGRIVAITAVLTMDLTVPGGVSVPMGGLTWVATLPTHRRQGLLSRLVAAHFEAMAARGEVISGLGATEGTIYGRFGYGPATSVISFSVERAHSAFAHPVGKDADGRLRMLDSKQAAALLPTVYDSLRLRRPGTVSRPPGLWHAHLADSPHERRGATPMFHVVHETRPGAPDGYASYRVKGQWTGMSGANVVNVVEVVASNPQAYGALWGYLLNMDLAQTISCNRGQVDEPLRWLLADPRKFRVDELSDFLWLRLLNVPSALSARRYSASGRLVLEVFDPFPTPTGTRFLLDVEPTSAPDAKAVPTATDSPFSPAECTSTTSTPDLVLDAGMLGAAYLGGVSFATLAAAGRVRELTPGAIARADAMFATSPAPHCATEF